MIQKMKAEKKKKMLIFTIIIVLIAVYIGVTFIPNIFVCKGIDLSKKTDCILVAHRGGAGLGYENTLECIDKGIAAGAQMIEIDIHLTKDNQLIVCHDQSVDRTTTGKGLIREKTLDELQQLYIKDESGKITSLHLPTLEEVLQLVNGRVKLLIEIKRTGSIYEGIEAKLLETLYRYKATTWCIVQSFNDSVLQNIHALNPGIRLEKLIICKFVGLPYIFDGTIKKFNFKKYEYISSFNFYYLSIPRYLIDEIHEAGKEVKMWTLQGADTTPNLPVNGIISNRPDLF